MRGLLLVACLAGGVAGQEQDPHTWWSLQPLDKPAVPAHSAHPIDAFVAATLASRGLAMSPQADARTLCRRVTFDLIGLPPSPEDLDAYVADTRPDKYERLVDRLLASPRHGERWARHWLDVVHYADTHGYDKDQPRPHAWPYRDYVIRAFDTDKPYARFVQEQVAGDVLFPGTRDGIEALGFLAAGPWDLIGHAEVAEDKIDGKIARHFDRDDMVGNVMGSFTSLTVQCAQCHDHKFDPVTQADYYALQAVFAALDRADKTYDVDQDTARLRREATVPPEFGWHSGIEASPDTPKWVQVDLGARVTIARVVLRGAEDDFNGIGAGFGFPRRFRIEVSDDDAFNDAPTVLAAHETEDLANPGLAPQEFAGNGTVGRFVRVTATRLAARKGDFIAALAELQVFDAAGANVALHAPVTSGDSIEAPPRWRRANLTDGLYPPSERASLPAPERVYAGTVHTGSGTFRGTGALGGKPRPIFVLARGQVTRPGREVQPAALAALEPLLPSRFDLAPDAPEGARRAALARWLTDPRNPLIWRSVVNRVWHYHFGRGLAATPDDFGRMGSPPTRQDLLDWLAATFRDDLAGSLKALHRLIVTSATYRQASTTGNEMAQAIDSGNTLLWRANARKLEAEAVRDAVLSVSGTLDLTAGGPGFRDFVLEHPEHSPHYRYDLADPDDPRTWRRSIYRFVVRSQMQPFLTALDCADPSMRVDRRNESVSPAQALALLNNGFILAQARHFAVRVCAEAGDDVAAQVVRAFRLAMGRTPTTAEREPLLAHVARHGLASTCRLLLNLNEFVFID